MYLLGVIPSVLMFENVSKQIHDIYPSCMSLIHGNLSRRSIIICFYSTQKEFNQWPLLEFNSSPSSLETAVLARWKEAQSNRGLANLPCLYTRDQSRHAAAALEGHFSI